MTHKHVIDAHPLIWYLEPNPLLSPSVRQILSDPQGEFILPVIALAEASFIVESGRKTKIPSVSHLLGDIATDNRIEIYPLTWEVFQQSLTLTSIPEIHDRLIVATALYLQNTGHTVDILTKDTVITRLSPVPVIW